MNFIMRKASARQTIKLKTKKLLWFISVNNAPNKDTPASIFKGKNAT